MLALFRSIGVSLLKHAKRRATNAALPPADEKRVEHAAIKPNVLQRRSLHRRHKDIACNVHSSEKRDRRVCACVFHVHVHILSIMNFVKSKFRGQANLHAYSSTIFNVL